MITGSCPALVTPMTPEREIDWDAFTDLIEWHIESGSNALVILGTTGESATLSQNERTKMISHSVEQVRGRIPVIIGTGTNSTQQSIHLTEEAKNLKADACLIVVPYYNRPTQEGIYQHFSTIADSVAIPQILYNVPGRTVSDMLPETVIRLIHHPHIVGIKEATGDLQRAQSLINEIKNNHQEKDFYLYSGDDPTTLDFLLLGGHGAISVTANVAPEKVKNMCYAALNNDIETAKKINAEIAVLNSVLFVEPNPIPVKWALYRMGKIQNFLRLPLTVLQKSFHEKVSHALQQLHIPIIK